MKDYALTATVEEEICLAIRQEAGNQYETLDYIPGRLLWGVFASLTGIRPGERPSPSFGTTFYSGEVIFASLHPLHSESNERSKPIPLSARTLKEAPGFHRDDLGDKPGHRGKGVCDWLIKGVPSDVDREDYIRHSGFSSGAPPNCQTVKVLRSFMTQHERDNLRGVTQEGRLFSRQTIARGQVFLGFLRSNSDAGDQALAWLMKTIGLYVPGELSVPIGRSPGRITLYVEEADRSSQEVTTPPLTGNDIRDEGGCGLFTVTCLSDMILLDAFLRPLKHLPEEVVNAHLGDTLQSCELYPHFAGTRIVQGWNGAYQRPCEEELAIIKGSAFCYYYELAQGKTTQDLAQVLNTFQRKGLGLRRAEGFGEVIVNDPFHFSFPNRIDREGEGHA